MLASGCSGACEIALGALANSGDNILVPRPCYHQCCTVAYSYGINVKFYRLLVCNEITLLIILKNVQKPCQRIRGVRMCRVRISVQ